MIARILHEKAGKYLAYLNKTGVSDHEKIKGNLGAYVARVDRGRSRTFLYEAIKRFAGKNYEQARYYPEEGIWGLIAVLVVLTFAVSWNLPAKGQDYIVVSQATPTPRIRDTRDLSKYGVVDYEGQQSLTGDEWEKRRIISQPYDKQEWVSKTMNNPEIGGIGRVQDLPPPPLFPFEECRLVILGDVVKAEAFLSNDKEGIYTELTIRIDEVLKGSKGSKQKKEIVADRGGGVVRYPNGQRVLYESSERGLPVIGSQYLFFLIEDEISPNYEILTSYEFRDGKVRQMEAGQSFEDFKNTDKTTFLNITRRKLQKSDQ